MSLDFGFRGKVGLLGNSNLLFIYNSNYKGYSLYSSVRTGLFPSLSPSGRVRGTYQVYVQRKTL